MEEEVETSISLLSAGRMGEVAAVRLAGGRGRGRGVLETDPGVSVFTAAVCGCGEDEGWWSPLVSWQHVLVCGDGGS